MMTALVANLAPVSRLQYCFYVHYVVGILGARSEKDLSARSEKDRLES